MARVFVGMGDAMVFISILRLIASWFPPMRNPVMTQFTSLLGQCGARPGHGCPRVQPVHHGLGHRSGVRLRPLE